MKNILILTILLAMIMVSCRKSDNPKLPDLARVTTPLVTLDPTSDLFIPPGAPATFQAKVVIDLKFKNETPKKFDAVIVKNDDRTNPKVLKADITTFPTTINITGQQLIDLFQEPIEDGDLFEIGVDVTTPGGMLFQAFPPGGAGYGSGVANLAGGVNTSVQFIKPCTFVAANYAGDFEVVSDEWEDYTPGAVIPVSMVNANQVSFEYNVSAGTAKPILLTIDPADNSISVARQEYGSYSGTKVFIESAGGSSVNPCNTSLTARLKHTLESGGEIGTYTIVLKKK